jgi:archaellum component FlaC
MRGKWIFSREKRRNGLQNVLFREKTRFPARAKPDREPKNVDRVAKILEEWPVNLEHVAGIVEQLPKRMDGFSQKLEPVAETLEQIGSRLERLAKPMEGLVEKLEQIQTPMEGLAKRVKRLAGTLERFPEMLEGFGDPLERLSDLVPSWTRRSAGGEAPSLHSVHMAGVSSGAESVLRLWNRAASGKSNNQCAQSAFFLRRRIPENDDPMSGAVEASFHLRRRGRCARPSKAEPARSVASAAGSGMGCGMRATSTTSLPPEVLLVTLSPV